MGNIFGKKEELESQLLTFYKGTYTLNKIILDKIKEIKNKITIISVLGPPRTGKSTLISLLFENYETSNNTLERGPNPQSPIPNPQY